MDYPPLLNEARGDYLSGQIQQAKDRLLAAKQLVNRRQNDLDTLKRQQLSATGLGNDMREDIRAAFRMALKR